MEVGETLEVNGPDDFADWLRRHGATSSAIWVILYKKASGKQRVTYDELVATALCYGWIDGQMKSIDGEKYAQRFTPRKKQGSWSQANKALAKALIATGRMTPAGYAVLPDDVQLPTLGRRQ